MIRSTVTLLKKWAGGIVLLLALTCCAAMAFHWSVWRGREAFLKHEAALPSGLFTDPALKLSETQKQQIRQLEADYHARMRDCCARHCAARVKIGELLRAGNSTEEELQKHVRDVSQAYAESEQATVHHVMAVGQVLTTEQKNLFLKKIAGQISATCPPEYMR